MRACRACVRACVRVCTTTSVRAVECLGKNPTNLIRRGSSPREKLYHKLCLSRLHQRQKDKVSDMTCGLYLHVATARPTDKHHREVRRPPPQRQTCSPSRFAPGPFSRSNHTSDFKTGVPVATLPGAWLYRICTGTGWPGISML